jgi:hypothetical protein
MNIVAIIGLIVCFLITRSFIFPAGILRPELAEITINGILQIVGGVVIIIVGWLIGGFMGGVMKNGKIY